MYRYPRSIFSAGEGSAQGCMDGTRPPRSRTLSNTLRNSAVSPGEERVLARAQRFSFPGPDLQIVKVGCATNPSPTRALECFVATAMGARLSRAGKARGSRGKFPPPRQDGDAYLIYVTPLSYEKWAFEGIDDDGLVGLKISTEYGFRIVTTADGHVLRQFPMSEVRSWQGSKKIFTLVVRDERPGEDAHSLLVPGLHPVGRRHHATLGPHRRAVPVPATRQVHDGSEFAALVRELDVLDADDPRRAEAALNFAGADKWVTSWQCIELLRRVPEGTDARVHAVAQMHSRMLDPAAFRLVMLELKSQEERDEAWEMISPSVGKDGERVRRSASG